MTGYELLVELIDKDYEGFTVQIRPNIKKLAEIFSKGVLKLRKSGNDIVVLDDTGDQLLITSDLDSLAFVIDRIL